MANRQDPLDLRDSKGPKLVRRPVGSWFGEGFVHVIVDGERPNRAAIECTDRFRASPREISSRSVSANARRDRLRCRGRIPPLLDRMPAIV